MEEENIIIIQRLIEIAVNLHSVGEHSHLEMKWE